MKMPDKITKARAGLVLDAPFFASILLKHEIKEDPATPTAWVDGKTMGYNPQWIESLSLDEIKGILCHEVMHVAAAHHLRRDAREHETWNLAADYAINGIIEEAGFKLPPGRMRSPHFDGKAAEEVYNTLYAQKPEPGKGQQGQQNPPTGNTPRKNPNPGNEPGQTPPAPPQNNDPGGTGEVRDLPGKDGQPATESEKREADQQRKIDVQQAALAAKRCGKLPGSLERLIEEISEPVLDYREILARFVDQAARNDYTWTHRNPRYSAFYLPALRAPELGTIALFIDTSGSIGQDEIKTFIGETQGILAAYPGSKIFALFIDAEIQGQPVEIEPGDTLDALRKPPGGGGTDFSPGFNYLDEHPETDPKAIIYFTDGECSRFAPEPEKPVLWILTHKNRSFSPPYGEIIHIAP